MSLKGLGVDLCDVSRMADLVGRRGPSLRGRVFTEKEWDQCGAKPESLAARWAAKEAFAKAVGTGIRGFAWTDVSVDREPSGRPRLVLAGGAADLVRQAGGGSLLLSFSHESGMAVAVVAWEA